LGGWFGSGLVVWLAVMLVCFNGVSSSNHKSNFSIVEMGTKKNGEDLI
jgi:hypothetical protein